MRTPIPMTREAWLLAASAAVSTAALALLLIGYLVLSWVPAVLMGAGVALVFVFDGVGDLAAYLSGRLGTCTCQQSDDETPGGAA